MFTVSILHLMEVKYLCAFKKSVKLKHLFAKIHILMPSFYESVFRNFSCVLCSTLKRVVTAKYY